MSLSTGIPKAKAICWAIRGQPQVGLRCFIWTTASTRSLPSPFGPGVRRRFGENADGTYDSSGPGGGSTESRSSVYAGLIFFSLLYAPVEMILSVVMQVLLRRNEHQADRYSVETTRDPDSMIQALKLLSRSNLSNLTPHPLYVYLNYSHPPVLARIQTIRRIPIGKNSTTEAGRCCATVAPYHAGSSSRATVASWCHVVSSRCRKGTDHFYRRGFRPSKCLDLLRNEIRFPLHHFARGFPSEGVSRSRMPLALQLLNPRIVQESFPHFNNFLPAIEEEIGHDLAPIRFHQVLHLVHT